MAYSFWFSSLHIAMSLFPSYVPVKFTKTSIEATAMPVKLPEIPVKLTEIAVKLTETPVKLTEIGPAVGFGVSFQ